MKHSEQINEIATALALAQSQMKVVEKEGTNPAFKSKYATLANVIDAIRPHLSANAIAFSQGLERVEEHYVMTTILMHKSGQWISYAFPITVPEIKTATVGHLMQAFGSITTYACRYGLTSACGVAPGEEDDDGESAKNIPVTKSVQRTKEQDEFQKYRDELTNILNQEGIPNTFLLEFCRQSALNLKVSGVEIMKELLSNKEKFLKEYLVYAKEK